ncbi:APC family permease [Gulosibacter molinativorax]|nr:APC family permease [Gulosibacter molinativorax]
MNQQLTPTAESIEAPMPRLEGGKLGTFSITFFVIAAAAPVAAFVGASPVLFSAVGPATPLIYVIAGLLVALFAVGYLRMGRTIANAGGFVVYIARGLGNRWAAGAAGIVIVTYLSLQVGLWAQFGVFAQQLVTRVTSLEIPPLVWIVLFLVVTTALTLRGVDASLRVLGTIIVLEILVVAALVVAVVAERGFGVFQFTGFNAESLFVPGFGVALLFAFSCFTTFEATVVFAEEAKDPKRTIPRALYLVIAFVAIFYFIGTWAVSGYIGPDRVQGVAETEFATMIFDVASQSAGTWLTLSIEVLVVTSFLAMLLGVSNMFARYLFALGRARVLPRSLAKLSDRKVPTRAVLVNSVVVLIIVAVFLLAGADPMGVVYSWFLSLGTAGFISILFIASIAIAAYFLRSGDWRTHAFSTVIAPIASVIVFAVIGLITLANYDALLGGGGDIAKWLLLALPLAFIVTLIVSLRRKEIDFSDVKL